MINPDDQAFPRAGDIDSHPLDGMNLRTYIATQVLAALVGKLVKAMKRPLYLHTRYRVLPYSARRVEFNYLLAAAIVLGLIAWWLMNQIF